MRRISLVAAGLILALPGCATTTTTTTTAAAVTAPDFCAVASPIYFDPADKVSLITDREIAEHNKKGEDLCGWMPLPSTHLPEITNP